MYNVEAARVAEVNNTSTIQTGASSGKGAFFQNMICPVGCCIELLVWRFPDATTCFNLPVPVLRNLRTWPSRAPLDR